ncbi:MAG TPA: thiamine-phosphate kinase [Bacteroidales bacterium]|nr:thiamine-phosphate kinase [Bacteroidales bacterium]
MSDQKTRTELHELGEFKLIDVLTQDIKLTNSSTVKGVGDDAAVIDPLGKQVVVTTDYLLEGIHFDIIYHPLKHLGYKAIMVNLSDVYAMNARPTQVTTSIGVSKRFCVEDLQELYAGMLLACELHGVDLVGGDTTSSLTGLTLSVTAIGLANKDLITYRSGAKVNDLICVTGDLGSAYMGLQLLEREKKVFSGNPELQPKLEGYDYILERFLKPEARKQLIDLLEAAAIVPTSMIDISDGLSSEMLHICKSSGVGCRIYLENIPIDQVTHKMAAELNIDPLVAALNGGEDYELLFTVPIDKHDIIAAMDGAKIIGHITESSTGAMLVPPQGEEVALIAQGWNIL